MFYLIKVQEGKTSIIKAVEDESQKADILIKELRQNAIKSIEKEEEAKLNGLYVYPLEVDKYQVVRRITEKDGWLFYGQCYNIHCYTYEFVWYDEPLV